MKQPFDDTTKSYFRRFFEERGLHAISQYEVFARSRSIDLVIESRSESVPQLQDTLFAHFRRLNALEFKGLHDPLTAVDLNRIMMRAWGVGAVDDTSKKHKRKAADAKPQLAVKEIAAMPHQRTVTIVCVTRPDKILNTLYDVFGFRRTAEAGIYCNHTDAIPVWIINPSELALKPQNYPLLPLARGKKLEQFVELCIQSGLVDLLQLTLDIGLATDPNIIWQKIMEIAGMELTVSKETWPYIDEFFRKVPGGFENVPFFWDAIQEAKQIAFEEAMINLRAGVEEEAQKALQEAQRVAQEKAQKALQEETQKAALIAAVTSKREMLLRVLRSKFDLVPQEIVDVIEATDNQTQLEAWFDLSLTTAQLDDIAFELESASETDTEAE